MTSENPAKPENTAPQPSPEAAVQHADAPVLEFVDVSNDEADEILFEAAFDGLMNGIEETSAAVQAASKPEHPEPLPETVRKTVPDSDQCRTIPAPPLTDDDEITADYTADAQVIIAFSASPFHDAYHADLAAYEEGIKTNPDIKKPDLAEYLERFQNRKIIK